MARLRLGVFIRASPERVWEVAADLPRQGDWMADVHELRVTGDKREGAGAVVEVRSRLFGLPLVRDVMEVETWDPPRELSVRHRGRFSGSGRFLLRPAGEGTVFLWDEEFRPPLGPLGEFAFALVVGPHLRRVFGRSLENLRRLAEASPPASRPPPRRARKSRRRGGG